MKEDRIERLIEKYNQGSSTLNEEQFLFDNAKNLEPSLEAWSTFVKNNKLEAPENFNDILWESFLNKKIRKRKIFVGIMSAAASVILLISLFIANVEQKKFNYSEKEALLNQAIDMVSNLDLSETPKSILYEDDMIIVFTTTE